MKPTILNKDVICLQRQKVYLIPDTNNNLAYASTVQSKLMQFGFILSENAFRVLKSCDVSTIIQYHNNAIDYLKDVMGGDREYIPLYGDFPIDMMEEKEALALQTQLAFLGTTGVWGGDILPCMPKTTEYEEVKYKVIENISESEFMAIFTDIVSINQSLTPSDKEVVGWFIDNHKPNLVIPDKVPFKETLCILAAKGLDVKLKDPTDVLRVAVYLSGGDVSLPKVPPKERTVAKSPWKKSGAMELNPERDGFKFKKWTRSERRMIMGLLDKTKCIPANMVTRSGRWLRLAHGLHSGEYARQFPNAYYALQRLRNTKKVKVRSWYSTLKIGFQKSLTKGLEILGEQPGEFMRRMDWLIRTNQNSFMDIVEVMRNFKIAAIGASNKVLFELYTHFEKRTSAVVDRTIMIKGARKHTKLPDLPAIDKSMVEYVQKIIKEVMESRFAKLPNLGKVWIDRELLKMPVPTNMRSLNLSLAPIMRGQRIPLTNPKAKVVRAYFHWWDEEGRMDPDLSATFVGTKKSDVVSYSSLKLGSSCHSGDVIARQGACAEYIDISIDDAKSMGYQYVVLDVRNYRGGSLKDIKGVFGMMEREHPDSNNSWLPDTVSNSVAMNSAASNTLVSIIDLQTMEWIFLDIDSTGTTFAKGDTKNILEVVEQYTKLPAFSAFRLLQMHARSRGEEVVDVSLAETLFQVKDFNTNYVELAKYMGI